MTTLVPMPMKLNEIRKKTTTWFATLTAATAPSDTWLTMKVSTVPIAMRSVCSTKMGHAMARRPVLAADGWVMRKGAGAYPGAPSVCQTVLGDDLAPARVLP